MPTLIQAPIDERRTWLAAARGAVIASPAARVIGFALLTWVGAKVQVRLPFTPVPGTLQTLPVLLAGALLGARAGAASQATYLMLGLSGLPVFALPGSGPLYFLGPTGGYLVGFVAAAYVTGLACRGPAPRGLVGTFIAFLAGGATLYLCGIAWLSVQLGGDVAQAVRAGLAPFALFDLAKIVIATGLCAGWRRVALTGGAAWTNRTPR